MIGTLALPCRRRAGMRVIVSTGDKDMAQLVNEHITLINTMTNSSLDRAGVKIKFDVYPEQIVDYLALVGDSSDNIPGVPKVGPKTAAKWLNEYRTLDNLIANQATHRRQGRRKPARVAVGPGAVARSCHDPLRSSSCPSDPKNCAAASPTTAKLRELYTRYELRSLLRWLSGTPGRPPMTGTSWPARRRAMHLLSPPERALQSPSAADCRRKAGRPVATTKWC